MLIKAVNSFFNNYFRFETDYFTVGGWRKNLSYFIAQGNIGAHLVDRIKFRIFPKLMITPSFPSHLDVEAASACQMRCPMCYTTHMSDDLKGVMKWNIYEKIVNEASDLKVYSIKLSWRGEPLLNKNIVKMVSYAKQKGIKEVSLLTNAELLTKKMAEGLVDAGLDWMSVSADGVGSIYNEIRAPAMFEETIEKVAYMKHYRDSKKLSKPLLRVQSIVSAVEDCSDAYFKAWEGVVDRINLISDHIRDFEDRNDLEYDPYYVCSKPWNRINISYDGSVHQCGADYSAKTIIANCRENSLYSIWHGKGMELVRKAFRKHTYLDDLPACTNCSYGLTRVPLEIKGGIKVGKYKSVPDVVTASEVSLKTPLNKLTPRQKKSLKNIK